MIPPRQVKRPLVKNCDPHKKTIPVIFLKKKTCDPGRNINLSIVVVLEMGSIFYLYHREGFHFIISFSFLRGGHFCYITLGMGGGGSLFYWVPTE